MGDYKQNKSPLSRLKNNKKKQTCIRQRGESWAHKNVLTPINGSQGQTVSLSPSCVANTIMTLN